MENKEKILNKVDELVSLIKNSDDYKRYIFLKEEMKNNKEIMNNISKIKKLEQTVVNKKYRKESVVKEEQEINSLKEELLTYPIYQEYSYLMEDLDNTFQNIREMLEKNINNN